MNTKRCAGILLHPTSLPGPYGIGDLGEKAYHWVDTLAQTGCTMWQVLPLAPTSYGDSPYQSFSAFAGNPYLISVGDLLELGLLENIDLDERPFFQPDWVDFGPLIVWKVNILKKAFRHFLTPQKRKPLEEEYLQFVEQEGFWLEDYAFFMAVKSSQGGRSWLEWPDDIRRRTPEVMASAQQTYQIDIDFQKFIQFIFFRQWRALREYANQKGIQVIGDIPLYVAVDSADFWVHPELFHTDENLKPSVVAGVPPDYFSETGQLWGNPIYDWLKHEDDGFAWWLSRISSQLKLVDILRIDHFRGFYNYWEVPAGSQTAIKGRWVPGPAEKFLDAVQKAFGQGEGMPIIAEDLGEIDPQVYILRDKYNLPGMKIFQFAFDSGYENVFLPHNYPRRCVAYTGTHDNDTTLGWYRKATPEEKDFCRRYLGVDGNNICWDMLKSLWNSSADWVLAPMQDFLCLDSHARMNFPGKLGGNWSWRMKEGAFSPDMVEMIRSLNQSAGR